MYCKHIPRGVAILLAALVLALPAVAQDRSADDGDEAETVWVGEDGQKHGARKVERQVWVTRDGDGDGESRTKVRVVLLNDGDEGPRTFEWSSEDGKSVVLKDGIVRFGESGEGLVHLEDLVARGFLGVQLVELTPELRQHYGVPASQGVLVGKVEPGSPAEAAGLRVGDVLTALDGEVMESSRQIRRHVRSLEEGESLAVEVYRNGSRLDLNATVVERERPEVDIRHLMERAEGPRVFTYRVDRQEVGDVLHEVRERLASPELRWRIESFQDREEELEERLQLLEEQLRELQRQLDEQDR